VSPLLRVPEVQMIAKVCILVFDWKSVPWLKQLATGLLPWKPRFDPSSVLMGYVVDTVVMGQVFL